MLFSKMKDSVLNLLTPSWLSDFLADLHISSPSDADSDRNLLKTDPEALVSEHRSNGIHGVQGQQAGSGTSFLHGEGSRPPDLDLISQDELQGEGQMMSLLNEADEFTVPGSEYRSAQLTQQPGRFILADHPCFQCSGSSSSVVSHRGLSERRYSEHKRKTFDHTENVSLWKKQKTDQLKLYEVMHGGLVTDALPYKQFLSDGYTRNTPVFSPFHRDMVEKLRVKAKPSRRRDRTFVTDSTSRRIQDVIDGNPKPLYMIIPDLQNSLTAPKLKFFLPAASQVKKTVLSNKQSQVNKGIPVSQPPFVIQSTGNTGAFVSQSTLNTGESISMAPLNTRTFTCQSTVNTSAFISQSPLNTGASISMSHVSTGALFSQSPVNTSTFISQSPLNTGASISMSPVSTGALFSQSPVNTSAFISQSPLNTGASISMSPVSTGALFSQSPVNTSAFISQSPLNTGASISMSPVSTGALFSQSPVNTSAFISQSPLNTGASISMSPVSTGALFSQSPVNTSAFISQSPLNTGASISMSPVSTGALFSQSPVNTSACISQSPLNTGASISMSPVSTGALFSQSPVNTSACISQSPLNTGASISMSPKDVKFQPVWQGLNLQPNKAIPARGSSVTPKSMVEETVTSAGTSISAVFKFPTQTSVPLSTAKSDLGTSSSYISTSPLENRSEPFVHSREDVTLSLSFSQDATSRSSSLSAASNRFLSANDLTSSNSTAFLSASNFGTGQGSNMALTSNRGPVDNTCITTSGFKFDSPASYVGQPVNIVASWPKTSGVFTSTPSFTSSTAINSTSQGLKVGSALQSCMATSSISAFKFSNDSCVPNQKLKFDTNSSSLFDTKLTSTANSIPSVPLGLQFNRSVSSVRTATLDTRSQSASNNYKSDSTPVQGFKYNTASSLTRTSQFDNDTKVASTMSSISTLSNSFSTTGTSAVSSTAISSLSTGPVSSSVINARSVSSFDSMPDLQLRTIISTTQGFEFNFVTASSSFVLKNSGSETTPSTIANTFQTFTSITKSVTTTPTIVCASSFRKESFTWSMSPRTSSVHGTLASDSSPTASVFSLDSESNSTTQPAGPANMYRIIPDVKVSVTDMVASSDTHSSHSIGMPSFDDINSNASVPAVGFGQPFQRGFHPDVCGSESMAIEEFRINVPTISPAVADTQPAHASDVTSKPQDMAVSDTEYRSPDQIFPQAVGQGDAVVKLSPEKTPQKTPAVHTPQGSPAFRNQQANNLIDHASYLVSKINTTKLDNHSEVVAKLPAEPDMRTVKGKSKDEETARKNRIKRLPEVTGGHIGIDNTVPTVNAVSVANAVPTVNTVPMVPIDTSDVITIPEPMYPPEAEQISANVMFKKVFCDIETTSLTLHTEIVQIAAVCEDETFDQYVLPMRKFDEGASKVTGLTCDGGVLYHHGAAVRTLDLKSALERFLGWLDPLKPCVFVGHNFKSFDYPRIYRAFTKFNLLNAFHQIVLGFVDSYPLFKAIYPEEKSYKQESLVAKYVKETYDAHNALGDVKSLKKLFKVSDKITHEVLCMYSYTANWYVEFHEYKALCNKNADTFKEIIDNKILSKSTIDKIAGSGLEMKHLKLVYNTEGPEALTDLLVSRASFSKATVGKLITFLASV